MRKPPDAIPIEIKLARKKWGYVGREKLAELQNLIKRYRLSVALGDVLYIAGHWYVTHSGLLRLACRRRCSGIESFLEKDCSDPIARRWVFKAVVHKSRHSARFVSYGDADPSNVSPLIGGAEMRVAETRAVSRALRKAYGIGLCSVEEIGWTPHSSKAQSPSQTETSAAVSNGHGQPRLRDRLCLLIRQHQLDATLVKAYAADYCGTATLREASRDSIEAFMNDLSERAAKDREGLVCHLNTYAKHQEVPK